VRRAGVGRRREQVDAEGRALRARTSSARARDLRRRQVGRAQEADAARPRPPRAASAGVSPPPAIGACTIGWASASRRRSACCRVPSSSWPSPMRRSRSRGHADCLPSPAAPGDACRGRADQRQRVQVPARPARSRFRKPPVHRCPPSRASPSTTSTCSAKARTRTASCAGRAPGRGRRARRLRLRGLGAQRRARSR
jgi:hypothetical protein